MVLFYILFFIVVIIFAIDFAPQFYTWQSRIKIGSFIDTTIWKKAIEKKSVQWLKNTPTIKLTDNTRLIFIDILRGNYKRSVIQDWQQASLVLGLNQCFEFSNDVKVQKEIQNFIDTKIAIDGNWKINPKEIDSVILAYSFLNCTFINHNQLKPCYDFSYNLILNLKGIDGTIAYKNHVKNYRFVDTIGFICPFLIRYGLEFNIPEAVQLGILQITEFNKYALLQDKYIPCHTYRIDSKLAVGLFGWGRGLGWYAIGLIDSWIALPENHESKNVLTAAVVNFAKMAVQYQNENGSWSWLISDTNARLDSSTTATLAWFLLNAATINEISLTCNVAKDKAVHYLMSVTRRDGTIDFSQGDTKAIGIHSQEFNLLPFTQGFALRTINK